MRDRRVLARLTILFVALSLVAAACGGGKSSSSSGSTTTSSQGKAVKGGTLVLGAEQEPDCADWIASCAGSSWGIWMFGAFTMPRVFGFDQASGVPKITPLVTSEPKLVDTNPGGMTVTYEISPKAVWSDGQPITSTDFKYTWTQIATGTEIYDKTGYEKITKIDDSNPKVAVVTFGEDYGGWHDLFGGFYGVYPSHLLAGKDRHAEMKDGYKWSGGPWMLDHWTKGQELKLVPNPKYWGAVPNLDAAVFKFVPQTSAEVEAYKSGQVAAIYPQAQLELEPLRTAPDTEFSVIDSLDYEALWFNVDKPPLNSLKVRQALAYATDRQAIVDALFKPVNPDIQPIQAFVTPANPKWYSDPFKIYTHDLKKVDELMTGDGWAKGSDGIYAKAGKKASLELNSTTGNSRRQRTGEILQSQWKEAGFDLKLNYTSAGTLFGQWAPQGIMVIGLYAQVPPSTDPGLCLLFCSKNIPTTAKSSGQNWTRLKSDALDKPWLAVDTTLDEKARKVLVDEGQKAIAAEVPALPIDPFPDIFVYNKAKLHGPLGNNVVYGPFWNMNEWWCTGGAC